MKMELKITAEHRVPDTDGRSYGVEEPGVTFELDPVHNGIVSIYRGDSPTFRVHISALLEIAKRFNAVTEYSPAYVPLSEWSDPDDNK